MTRKDCIIIAQAIRNATPVAMIAEELPLLKQAHENTAIAIAAALKADNHRFDRVRFMEACGLEN